MVSFSTSCFEKDVDKLEIAQLRATKMMLRVLGNMIYEEALKEIGLFSLEDGGGRDLIKVFIYLTDGCKENRDRLVAIAQDRTKNNGFKLQQAIIRLVIRKKFLTIRVL